MNSMEKTLQPATLSISEETREQISSASRSLWHDAMLLGKPRITLMVLTTVGLGFLLAPGSGSQLLLMINAILGVGLVAASSGILNQAWERDTDALMRRTQSRPLPTGRIRPQVGYSLGIAFGVVGVGWLILTVNVLTALLSLLTLVGYVLIYTPMKRYSAWNTLAGAIPGAMPPLLGYAAVANSLSAESWFLFGILFLWQFPHFFAIAWMYKDDYAKAGLVMLSTIDRWQGKLTAGLMIVTCWALLAFSLLPGILGWTGVWYLGGALLFGSLFCFSCIRFLMFPTRQTARHTLWVSLLYLPPVFLLYILDGPKIH